MSEDREESNHDTQKADRPTGVDSEAADITSPEKSPCDTHPEVEDANDHEQSDDHDQAEKHPPTADRPTGGRCPTGIVASCATPLANSSSANEERANSEAAYFTSPEKISAETLGMPIMCCVCRKVKTADDAWIEPEEIIPEEVHVSHGFCPPCAVVEWDKISRRRAAAAFPFPLGGDTAAQNSPPE